MRTVTIRIKEKELNALEDALVAWTLCKKHNAEEASDIVRYQYTISCKECIKLNKEIFDLAWAVQSKLWRAYKKQDKVKL